MADEHLKDQGHFRASATMACPRRLWLERAGLEPHPVEAWRQKMFDMAEQEEARALELYEEDSGDAVVSRQATVVWQPAELQVPIIGHVDGMVGDADPPRVVEVKSLGEARWGAFTTDPWDFPNYMAQLVCYTAGAGPGADAILIARRWMTDEDQLVMPFGINDIGALREEYEPLICTRLTAVLEAAEATDLPEEPDEFGCDSCSMRYHCKPDAYLDEPPMTVDNDADTERLMSDYTSVARKRAYYEDRLVTIRDHMGDRLRELDVEVVVVPGLGKFQFVSSSRSTLDKKALAKRVGQGVIDDCTTAKASTSVRVYPTGGDEK